MGVLARSAVLLGFSLAPGTTHAHGVPGDPDSGSTVYLLPGPLVSLVVPFSGERPPVLMDVGLEVSVFRFVPTGRRVWSQCGYGALAQAQLGGVQVQAGDTPAPSLHLRLALGAEGTFGPLGAHAGLLTRVSTGNHAGMVGAFAGVFPMWPRLSPVRAASGRPRAPRPSTIRAASWPKPHRARRERWSTRSRMKTRG